VTPPADHAPFRDDPTLLRRLKSAVKNHVPRSRIDQVLLTFPALYPAVRFESQLTPAQLAHLQAILDEGRPGNIIECGVYRAGTTVLMARHLRRRGLDKVIYALDSYAGFDTEHEVGAEIQRGLLIPEARSAFTSNSVEYVRAKLRKLRVDDLVRVVPGYFQDTLPGIDDRFCLALIDCDLDKSTQYCLEHLWPRVVEGGSVVVDDYMNPGYPGAAVAADRFFADVPHRKRLAADNFLIVQK
jgi:predicted O-methyltransferase YrrM